MGLFAFALLRARVGRKLGGAFFTGSLEELGWAQAEVARRLDIGADSVSAWRRGRSRLPGPVVAYFGSAQRARALLQ